MLFLRTVIAIIFFMEIDIDALKTYYYYYGNQEGDGYEVYFEGYPDVKGWGDTYEEALEDAKENLERLLSQSGSR